MNHDNDISIGKNEWITWVDPSETETPLDIDNYIDSTKMFWKHLETECVSACCGIDAFGLWPSNIQNAKKIVNQESIKQDFEKLKLLISERPENTLISEYLNNVFDKTIFLQLLSHIISHL